MNIHPKHDMLLLQAMESAETSKGGIIIPEAHRHQINQGILIEAGSDIQISDEIDLGDKKIKTIPKFKIGEIVIFPLHSEYKVKDDDNGTEYYLVRASEIIAGDNGEQAQSEGGVEPLKLNRNKPKNSPSLQDKPKPERRKPIGLLSKCATVGCNETTTSFSHFCEKHSLKL